MNLMFVFMFGIGAPVAIGFIFGWDAAGVWYGIHRSFVVDSAILLHTLIKSWVLLVPKNVLRSYGCAKDASKASTSAPSSTQPFMASTPATATPSKAKAMRDNIQKMIDEEMQTMERDAANSNAVTPMQELTNEPVPSEEPIAAVQFVTTSIIDSNSKDNTNEQVNL